jgi:Outer membrane protein beta-barrel domain
MRIRAVMAAAALVATCVPSASAQSQVWDHQGFIAIYGGAQSGSSDLTDNRTFTIYDEDATLMATQDYGGGGLFWVGGGFKVWESFLVGAAVSYTSDNYDSPVIATIPNPLVFNQPRTAALDVTGLTHKETTFHLQAIWMLPLSERFDVGLSFGPSFFNVEHEFVGDLAVEEQDFPFNTVVIAPGAVRSESKTAVGFNLGAEATYGVTEMLGVSGFLRYARATASMPGTAGDVDVKAGGVMFGIGARVAF